jgi:hypothetical protein
MPYGNRQNLLYNWTQKRPFFDYPYMGLDSKKNFGIIRTFGKNCFAFRYANWYYLYVGRGNDPGRKRNRP